MKHEIIKKALIILGSYSGINISNKTSKAESLCIEFAESAVEDTVLSIKWSFALKRINNITGVSSEFKEIEAAGDCIKLAIIVPSNLEFYIEGGKIYFKGNKLTSLFYYPRKIIDDLLNSDVDSWRVVPESFKILAALYLASQVAFALYSDSLFADGLKKQYLIKLEQTRQIYGVDYNLTNSGEI